MRYSKPHRTYVEQLELLSSRGLGIQSRDLALEQLRLTGYYRLKGYWFQWRDESVLEDGSPSEQINGNHYLDEAISLYAFDRRLRLMLLDALERIEVACRVETAYVVGKRGPLSYLDPRNLGSMSSKTLPGHDKSCFEEFIDKHQNLVARSKEQFARHYIERYDGGFPIWSAVELWDFGTLSHFYRIASQDDQDEIADNLGVPGYKLLSSWLLCLSDLRNLCAHHNRLFRKTPVNKPMIKGMRRVPLLAHIEERSNQKADLLKLYPAMSIVMYLMVQIIPESFWPMAFAHYLEGFPDIPGNSLADYGFPPDWQDEDLWSFQSS